MTGIDPQEIRRGILANRRQSVFVDATIADLYDVTLKEVNQAVSNNPDKFSPAYIIELPKGGTREGIKNIYHLGKVELSPHLPKTLIEKSGDILGQIRTTDVEITSVPIFAFLKFRRMTGSEEGQV